MELTAQFKSVLSVPIHCTLSNQILPVPSPKLARLNASAPNGIEEDLVALRNLPNNLNYQLMHIAVVCRQ